MNIRTERTPVGDWYAIDADTYDGAPDAGRAGATGWGKTERQAIDDLADQRGAETPTSAIRDFLMAVDRGYLGEAIIFCGVVIANGDKTKFRTWGHCGLEWTADIFEATWHVRREDAERACLTDEDGCFILGVADVLKEAMSASQ